MPTNANRVSARRNDKKAIREMLSQGDMDGIVRQARDAGAKRTFRHLLIRVHDRDDTVRWRAIEGCGLVAGVMAEDDLSGVKDTIRKLMWWMNDESGALLRVAPEILAEILVNVEVLVDEYARMLPQYLTEEPFERGSHWAVYRVLGKYPNALSGVASRLLPSLESEDAYIRDHARKSLELLGELPA
jgi:hypothetical protein